MRALCKSGFNTGEQYLSRGVKNENSTILALVEYFYYNRKYISAAILITYSYQMCVVDSHLSSFIIHIYNKYWVIRYKQKNE